METSRLWLQERPVRPVLQGRPTHPEHRGRPAPEQSRLPRATGRQGPGSISLGAKVALLGQRALHCGTRSLQRRVAPNRATGGRTGVKDAPAPGQRALHCGTRLPYSGALRRTEPQTAALEQRASRPGKGRPSGNLHLKPLTALTHVLVDCRPRDLIDASKEQARWAFQV